MSSGDHGSTPRFLKPPVIETVLGVQFNRLVGMHITHVGLFWQKIREQFPLVSHHPQLAPTIEGFGRAGLEGGPKWLLSKEPELPRTWFLSEDSPKGQQLIQLQPDRFLQNWRRSSLETQEYSSYEANRSEFQSNLSHFLSFLAEERLGGLAPTQCEVTYINHIPLDDGCSIGQMARKCFPSLAGSHSDAFLPSSPEQFTDHQVSYRIEETHGRLHIRVQPAFSIKTGETLLRLLLTARGAPNDQGLDALLDWLDLGHYWVVKGFRSFTSGEMHERWAEQT